MIKKIKSHIFNIKDLLIPEVYKSIFLSIIFGCLIVSYTLFKDSGFENGFLFFISSNLYQIMILLIFVISSFYVSLSFDKKLEILLRYNDKASCFKKLLIYVTIINAILYVFSIICCFILLSFAYTFNFHFMQFDYYNIPFCVYNIFTIFKYFFVLNSLSLIIVEIRRIFNNIGGAIGVICILFLKDGWPYSINIIDDFTKISLFFGYYLYPYQYSNFYLEIFAFLLQVLILSSIIYALFMFMKKINKANLIE